MEILYQVLAYFLAVLFSLTLGTFLGFMLKLFILAGFLLMFRMSFFRHLGLFLSPTTFVSSILQGYISIALSVWVFSWFSYKLPHHYVVLLGVLYAWQYWDNARQQKKKAASGEDSDFSVDFINRFQQPQADNQPGPASDTQDTGYTLIEEDGEERSIPSSEEQAELQAEQKKNLLATFRGKELVGLIGRVTGAVLGGMNMIS